jgi:uncharacterized protein YhbP (UPF0306 family)
MSTPGALRATALAYLRAHNVMTLATTGDDGPWAAAVFYASADFALYFVSSPEARHSRNLALRPRVAVTVQEDYRDWTAIKGLQIEGTARVITGPEQSAAASTYRAKYPFTGTVSTLAAAFARVAWYMVEPDRVFYLDNSVRFGYREEIPLVAG